MTRHCMIMQAKCWLALTCKNETWRRSGFPAVLVSQSREGKSRVDAIVG